MIPNLKRPYPDELLISYICRTAKLNGADLDGFASTFLMTRDMQADAAPVFPEFYRQIYHPGGMAGMFLALTTFAFESIAMSPGQQARYILSASGDPIAMPFKPLFQNVRVCPECVKEDIGKYGEPYYHRSHNLSGVTACHKHHVPLLQNRGGMPTVFSFDLSRFGNIKTSKDAADYADYAAAFLQKGYTANALMVKEMLADVYRERGYAIHEGLVPPVLEVCEWQRGVHLEDPDTRLRLVEKHLMDVPGTMRLLMSLFPDPEGIPLPANGMLVAAKTCPACGAPYLTTPAGSGYGCPKCAKNIPHDKRIGGLVKTAWDGEYGLIGASHGGLTLRHLCGREIRVPLVDFLFNNARCSCGFTESGPPPWDMPVVSDNHQSSLTAMRKNEYGVTECIYHKFLPTPDHKPTKPGPLTEEEYKQAVHGLAGDNYSVAGEFNGSNKPVEIRHNECGHTFRLYRADSFLSGKRCPECSGKFSYIRLDGLLNDRFGGRYKLVKSIHLYDVIDTYTGKVITMTAPEILQEINRPGPSGILPLDGTEELDAVSYWYDMYSLLLDYRAENGVSSIPGNLWYHGRPLGLWRKTQIESLKSGSLTEEKIKLLINAGVAHNLLKNTYSIPASEQWIRNCDRFARYVRQTGSVYVPSDAVFENENLGAWIRSQKNRRATLSQDKIDRLEAIDPDFFKTSIREQYLERTWEFYINLYKRFAGVYDADSVKESTVFEDACLGTWLMRQRAKYRKGMLTKKQISDLISINPHVFDQGRVPVDGSYRYLIPPRDAWDKKCALFERFVKKYGAIAITRDVVFENENLGIWISHQRDLHNKGELSDERARRMLSIDPDVFNPLRKTSDEFEKHFAIYKQHAEETGSPYVSHETVVGDFNLGLWYLTIRVKYHKGELPPERAAMMLSVDPGFSDPDIGMKNKTAAEDDAWEEWYSLYKEFVEETGSAYVEKSAVYKNKRLGRWYHNQLYNYRHDKLSDSRIKALRGVNPDMFK